VWWRTKGGERSRWHAAAPSLVPRFASPTKRLQRLREFSALSRERRSARSNGGHHTYIYNWRSEQLFFFFFLEKPTSTAEERSRWVNEPEPPVACAA
jgi:predicted transcriptional regulator